MKRPPPGNEPVHPPPARVSAVFEAAVKAEVTVHTDAVHFWSNTP